MSDLILTDVSFSYPGGFLAVDHINMEIKSGENVAIVGQNGAGKTTTVKMMNGLLKPTEGDVLIGDMNTKNYTTAQVSRVVAQRAAATAGGPPDQHDDGPHQRKEQRRFQAVEVAAHMQFTVHSPHTKFTV